MQNVIKLQPKPVKPETDTNVSEGKRMTFEVKPEIKRQPTIVQTTEVTSPRDQCVGLYMDQSLAFYSIGWTCVWTTHVLSQDYHWIGKYNPSTHILTLLINKLDSSTKTHLQRKVTQHIGIAPEQKYLPAITFFDGSTLDWFKEGSVAVGTAPKGSPAHTIRVRTYRVIMRPEEETTQFANDSKNRADRFYALQLEVFAF